MKKYLVALFLLMLFLLSSSAFAVSITSKGIHVSRLTVFNVPPDLNTVVNVENKLSSKVDDVRVFVVIPELGIRRSAGPFDIASGGEATKRIFMDTPSAESGEYYVRITVSSDKFRRVKYRIITI